MIEERGLRQMNLSISKKRKNVIFILFLVNIMKVKFLSSNEFLRAPHKLQIIVCNLYKISNIGS